MIKKFNEMAQNRETIRLGKNILRNIAGSFNNKIIKYDGDEYTLYEDEITSSDPEDGGQIIVQFL